MHIACRCGERFMISVDRLPHKIRCHACNRLFEVGADGRTSDMREPDVIALQPKCRCGQIFTVHATHFPRQIRCHECGRSFSVLDNGEIVDLDAMALPPIDATALQSGMPAALVATSIQPDDGIGLGRGNSTAGTVSADLKLLDLQWNAERDTYSLIPFIGISIMPSRRFSVVAGVILAFFLIPSSFLLAMVIGGGRGSGGVVTIAIALTVFVPMYIYRRSIEYERAVADWQRKRVVAIAKARRQDDDA